MVLLASASGACSLSFPIAGFKTDDAPTGSVDRSAASLSPALDREDWRRARAALSVALDPQGSGAPVAWQNPSTGAKGSFAAPETPFLDHDRVCRTFLGRLTTAAEAERRVAGSACRDGDGTWSLRDVKDRGTS